MKERNESLATRTTDQEVKQAWEEEEEGLI
jgi:hypothetical protein